MDSYQEERIMILHFQLNISERNRCLFAKTECTKNKMFEVVARSASLCKLKLMCFRKVMYIDEIWQFFQTFCT